ncbi:MAG: hypothetical protein QOE62_1341, partial [Actinomycetota bacterium]|nr:hypothetical protein [Actinomycetota bacterium]
MRNSVKGALGLGILGGVALAAWRAFAARAAERPRGVEWESAPFPFPPVPRPAMATPTPSRSPAPAVPSAVPASVAPAWTEPNADGSCPSTHPVKAKLSSGIFHVPG